MFDMFKFRFCRVVSVSEGASTAAEILCDELKKRGIFDSSSSDFFIIYLKCDSSFRNDDLFSVALVGSELHISAKGTRGLIYGIGRFLRKLKKENDFAVLIEDISGEYSPFMKIRGHQLGYRVTANSYEAWTPNQYFDYIKELMYFGVNVFEHTVFNDIGETNPLMKYSVPEMISLVNEKAKTLGIDISYWCPNDGKELTESIKDRAEFFKNQKYADIYFPPGSDPGEFPADELIDRVIAIAKELRKTHPELELWPSAQSPDGFGKWGDDFIEKMMSEPDEINGIITGPNCAMPLHDLRKRLSLKYPIRLYPDITHNLRCEYPVHFSRDDWHYSLSSAMSREAVNPRPCEYRNIHRLTRQYLIGSVTYSEGISDDVNKFVWSDMDFDPDVELTDTLNDYSRLFFFGADTEKIANGILALEKNWEGDPKENPHIENTHDIFVSILEESPFLSENVRFLLCLFRAKCDLLIKKRRVFESELIKKAKHALKHNDIIAAENILKTDFGDDYNKLHDDIFNIGHKLFEMAGLQLDVEHYYAKNWERGATLDTIDRPVTDRKWLLNRLDYCKTLAKDEQKEFISALLERNSVKNGFYFSFAENSFTDLGVKQEPYFYMDFQGDRPDVNNGSIPMSMLKVYDHYSFSLKTGGLSEKRDYKLRLNIKPRYNDSVTDFTIKINGRELYRGKQYGGVRDEKWEKEMSASPFELHEYVIPASFIENGCIELQIAESKIGIMISEIFIL